MADKRECIIVESTSREGRNEDIKNKEKEGYTLHSLFDFTDKEGREHYYANMYYIKRK